MDELRNTWRSYALALGGVAVTVAIRLALWPIIGDDVPHQSFFPAVLLAAYYGGFGPGLLATLLGAFFANVLFTEPHFVIGIKNLNAALAMPLFVTVGLLISGLFESLLQTQRRLLAEERERAAAAIRETEAAAVRASEERFRGTFENAAVGIAHCDLQGQFIRVNQKLCEILGYSREELLALKFQMLTHPDDLVANVAKFEALARGEIASYTLEKRHLSKDGSPIWTNTTVSLQRDEAGLPVHTIGVVEDFSEQKRLEAELRHTTDVAERANRAKDEFLANVSHEIRTPMNAILGLTDLVLETELREDQRQSLRTVKSAADNLLGIINDLLDFSKIEAGKIVLDPYGFSLRAMIGDTLRALAPRAHEKGLELVSQIHADVPDALVGDAGRLRQVLLNLIGNAIKFTSSGEVVVSIQPAAEQSDDEFAARFFVRDTGIGIVPEMQTRIFRAFEQEDNSTTRRFGGTGLGLSIAARLVGLMGGSITVESQPGRGSTFAFTGRFGRQPQTNEPGPSPPVPHGLRVLVVDDNATNRHILEETLLGWQLEPEMAGDAVAATGALWHALTQGAPYPLVLLDARMPDTDGLVLAARIREWPALATTRIILMTSGDRPADVARARELHIEAHLLKPVQQEDILETISRVMSRSNSQSKGVPHSPRDEVSQDSAMAPLRVLVAEDNDFNAQMVSQLLARRGHRVQVAANGREALALAAGNEFDLLLLDLHMPDLDGFQVIQTIRRHEHDVGGHLPVIAFTARSRAEDREQCLAAGMDDFLTKPVRAPDLFAAIERAVPMAQPSRVNESLLTPGVLISACEDDPALLKRLCGWFRERAPEHLTALAAAREALDAAKLRETAHKLCSMVATFSTSTGELASMAEDQAAAGAVESAAAIALRVESATRDLLQLIKGLTLDRLHALLRHPAAKS